MPSRLVCLAVTLFLSACTPWVCDPTTCDTGCCDSTGTCILNGGDDFCGIRGARCQECMGACLGGRCECPAGLELLNGKCVCTPRSCADGCCVTEQTFSTTTQQCRRGSMQSTSTCGVSGQSCMTCVSGALCVSGRCCTSVGSECSSSLACCSPFRCQFNNATGRNQCQ